MSTAPHKLESLVAPGNGALAKVCDRAGRCIRLPGEMADLVTLVIVLAAGEAASPTASAMAQGARDAFAGVVAEVQESPTVPTDADALAVEGQSHPDAVAELIWHDADRRHATLRVHLRQSRRWIERSFVFGASDPTFERGRTLGFAVASILPELGARPPGSSTAPTTTTAAGTSTSSRAAPASPATASAVTPATATASCTPDAGTACPPAPPPGPDAPSSPPAPSAATPSSPAAPIAFGPASSRNRSTADRETDLAPEATGGAPFREPHLAVDLLAVGATAIAGGANSVANSAGGAGAVEWFVHPRLSLRLGGAVRAGALDVAEAHVTNLLASAGAVVVIVRPTRSLPFAAAVRADYLLEHESATHFDSDDPSPVTRGRWVSGMDAFADVSLLLSSQIAAVMGFGVEDVWAPTYVYVRDAEVATLPRLRGLVEAGFQLRF
jgi:hypothetical protein